VPHPGGAPRAEGGEARPYRLILMDCDDASTFVVERKQPELANSVMPSWVRFLRDDACEYF
jgi:hypothetical protein